MPLVGIVMGSDSDLPMMKQAAEVLNEFGVDYEMTIISAHRSPKRAIEYASTAPERGLEVIIAGAGGAAHLPGVLAAMTPLPVIGVPIKTNTLDGVDSLYSIVQMPSGIPVATVGINGAKNAGILAVQILSVVDSTLRQKMIDFKKRLAKEVNDKAVLLEEIGYPEYLKRKEEKRS
ncbi:5-(carboxyamino)imidazole ribonucleotide mutase [Hydrogenispora ethanolica]|jgi:5-(carboxyamino)imidazole ribonucleotide mutase|uniref:N5-carboxyaminoimidazole ribonucleotide mutase n=1 Tax=Hydrogenispora ethanolica TaxID=1082276 RepID=A0A4R1QR88_HYDET|nr:5-(carboxyamino)imidazole ribonucleotide mutase [Hydrogenispora ethanolica]TCL54865.1 5-(carboxyamino)imidazole ribonucleotide mutase [Hydrogenispora ethanolica]